MSDFQREDRYLVIKYSDMEKLPNDARRNFSGRCRSFYEQMLIAGAPARSFLVIESDWPEYDPARQMIERRMTGQPTVTAAEELDAVLHWRGKHAIAIKERDALQQRLNAADQRMDDQYGLLLAWYESNAEGLVRVDDAAYHIVTATAEALDGKPTESGASE